jgi:hypothetical protein
MTRKEELEDLTSSPGWAHLVKAADLEYGDGGAAWQSLYGRLEQTTPDAAIGAQVRAMKQAQQAVRWLIFWPKRQIQELNKT